MTSWTPPKATRCGVCGKDLDRPVEYPGNVQVRSHGMTYEAHEECADDLKADRDLYCGSGEHNWPADLGEEDAECERCGLLYAEWSE